MKIIIAVSLLLITALAGNAWWCGCNIEGYSYKNGVRPIRTIFSDTSDLDTYTKDFIGNEQNEALYSLVGAVVVFLVGASLIVRIKKT